MLQAIPFAVMPADKLAFRRMTVLPGVVIERFEGRLAEMVDARRKTLPVSPGFKPTHEILIDSERYLRSLDERLKAEGKSRPKPPHQFGDYPDIDGIKRQVLVAITLCGRLAWEVGGVFTVNQDDRQLISYGHSPTESIAPHSRWMEPIGGFKTVAPGGLRRLCRKTDRYYRTGSWWIDRLSVALGYLWSALTTTRPELAFAALCMAVEAIATTSPNEVTNTLAVRCAILGRTQRAERLKLYDEVRDLYKIRSKVVHGRSAPPKGTIDANSLAITAKMSVFPRTAVARMLGVTIDVINGVLQRQDLLTLLHAHQSEEKEKRAINDYFHPLLLR